MDTEVNHERRMINRQLSGLSRGKRDPNTRGPGEGHGAKKHDGAWESPLTCKGRLPKRKYTAGSYQGQKMEGYRQAKRTIELSAVESAWEGETRRGWSS